MSYNYYVTNYALCNNYNHIIISINASNYVLIIHSGANLLFDLYSEIAFYGTVISYKIFKGVVKSLFN